MSEAAKNLPALVIAIDGPAASGKGTLSRRIARYLGLAHLDTGALYRATARDALAAGIDPTHAEAVAALARTLDAASLGDPRLREEDIGRMASVVAAYPAVRAALLDYQRNFAAQGAVLDGRDIGTVVCPEAPVKLFVTASVEARALRRTRELAGRGEAVDFPSVLEDLRRRDARDSARAAAPLRPAADAFLLDTTALDADQAYAAALSLVESRISDVLRD